MLSEMIGAIEVIALGIFVVRFIGGLVGRHSHGAPVVISEVSDEVQCALPEKAREGWEERFASEITLMFGSNIPDPWVVPTDEDLDEALRLAGVLSSEGPEVPAAIETMGQEGEIEKAEVAIDSMTNGQLRKACSTAGIKWRNHNGKNRHATNAQMKRLLLNP